MSFLSAAEVSASIYVLVDFIFQPGTAPVLTRKSLVLFRAIRWVLERQQMRHYPERVRGVTHGPCLEMAVCSSKGSGCH